MIRIIGDRIRWTERDVNMMAAIVGPEMATKEWAPLNPSILKLAARKGVRLHTQAKSELHHAKAVRKLARAMQRSEDADAFHPLLKRAFPHQRVALDYFRLTKLPGYLLADAPGVGKTLAAMLWAHLIVQSQRTLVICPNTAKRQWRREIQRYLGAGTRVTIVEGTIVEQTEIARRAAGWVIGHWESLTWAQEGYVSQPWDAVILDEAHHIRNRDAQRTNVVFGLDAKHRMALTGHPYANDPAELHSILKFLYPELYESYWRFFHQHVRATPKAFGGYEIEGARRPKLLRWEIAPFTIRRTKQEVFKDLPPITRVIREVELTSAMRKEYDRLRKEFFVEIDRHPHDDPKILAIPSVLARITRLRQYLVDPSLIGSKHKSVKFPAISEWLRDLDGPPVIFSQYREALLNLSQFLSKQHFNRLAFIYGRQNPKVQEKAKADFLAGKLDALLVVTAAGRESLNLGKFGYVGHLDLPWNAMTLEQSEGRVDRPEEGTGLLVPTTSYPFVVADSYEDRMIAKLENKHKQFVDVFNPSDLRRLFA